MANAPPLHFEHGSAAAAAAVTSTSCASVFNAYIRIPIDEGGELVAVFSGHWARVWSPDCHPDQRSWVSSITTLVCKLRGNDTLSKRWFHIHELFPGAALKGVPRGGFAWNGAYYLLSHTEVQKVLPEAKAPQSLQAFVASFPGGPHNDRVNTITTAGTTTWGNREVPVLLLRAQSGEVTPWAITATAGDSVDTPDRERTSFQLRQMKPADGHEELDVAPRALGVFASTGAAPEPDETGKGGAGSNTLAAKLVCVGRTTNDLVVVHPSGDVDGLAYDVSKLRSAVCSRERTADQISALNGSSTKPSLGDIAQRQAPLLPVPTGSPEASWGGVLSFRIRYDALLDGVYVIRTDAKEAFAWNVWLPSTVQRVGVGTVGTWLHGAHWLPAAWTPPQWWKDGASLFGSATSQWISSSGDCAYLANGSVFVAGTLQEPSDQFSVEEVWSPASTTQMGGARLNPVFVLQQRLDDLTVLLGPPADATPATGSEAWLFQIEGVDGVDTPRSCTELFAKGVPMPNWSRLTGCFFMNDRVMHVTTNADHFTYEWSPSARQFTRLTTQEPLWKWIPFVVAGSTVADLSAQMRAVAVERENPAPDKFMAVRGVRLVTGGVDDLTGGTVETSLEEAIRNCLHDDRCVAISKRGAQRYDLRSSRVHNAEGGAEDSTWIRIPETPSAFTSSMKLRLHVNLIRRLDPPVSYATLTEAAEAVKSHATATGVVLDPDGKFHLAMHLGADDAVVDDHRMAWIQEADLLDERRQDVMSQFVQIEGGQALEKSFAQELQYPTYSSLDAALQECAMRDTCLGVTKTATGFDMRGGLVQQPSSTQDAASWVKQPTVPLGFRFHGLGNLVTRVPNTPFPTLDAAAAVFTNAPSAVGVVLDHDGKFHLAAFREDGGTSSEPVADTRRLVWMHEQRAAQWRPLRPDQFVKLGASSYLEHSWKIHKGHRTYPTLEEAVAECATFDDCHGVTQLAPPMKEVTELVEVGHSDSTARAVAMEGVAQSSTYAQRLGEDFRFLDLMPPEMARSGKLFSGAYTAPWRNQVGGSQITEREFVDSLPNIQSQGLIVTMMGKHSEGTWQWSMYQTPADGPTPVAILTEQAPDFKVFIPSSVSADRFDASLVAHKQVDLSTNTSNTSTSAPTGSSSSAADTTASVMAESPEFDFPVPAGMRLARGYSVDNNPSSVRSSLKEALIEAQENATYVVVGTTASPIGDYPHPMVGVWNFGPGRIELKKDAFRTTIIPASALNLVASESLYHLTPVAYKNVDAIPTGYLDIGKVFLEHSFGHHRGHQEYASLAEAVNACNSIADCVGVTKTSTGYDLRGSRTKTSHGGYHSWERIESTAAASTAAASTAATSTPVTSTAVTSTAATSTTATPSGYAHLGKVFLEHGFAHHRGHEEYGSLQKAAAACNLIDDCVGVTQTSTGFDLRGSRHKTNHGGYTSWERIESTATASTTATSTAATSTPVTSTAVTSTTTTPSGYAHLGKVFLEHSFAHHRGHEEYGSLQEAAAACNLIDDCVGVTQTSTGFDLRGSRHKTNHSGYTSWERTESPAAASTAEAPEPIYTEVTKLVPDESAPKQYDLRGGVRQGPSAVEHSWVRVPATPEGYTFKEMTDLQVRNGIGHTTLRAAIAATPIHDGIVLDEDGLFYAGSGMQPNPRRLTWIKTTPVTTQTAQTVPVASTTQTAQTAQTVPVASTTQTAQTVQTVPVASTTQTAQSGTTTGATVSWDGIELVQERLPTIAPVGADVYASAMPVSEPELLRQAVERISADPIEDKWSRAENSWITADVSDADDASYVKLHDRMFFGNPIRTGFVSLADAKRAVEEIEAEGGTLCCINEAADGTLELMAMLGWNIVHANGYAVYIPEEYHWLFSRSRVFVDSGASPTTPPVAFAYTTVNFSTAIHELRDHPSARCLAFTTDIIKLGEADYQTDLTPAVGQTCVMLRQSKIGTLPHNIEQRLILLQSARLQGVLQAFELNRKLVIDVITENSVEIAANSWIRLPGVHAFFVDQAGDIRDISREEFADFDAARQAIEGSESNEVRTEACICEDGQGVRVQALLANLVEDPDSDTWVQPHSLSLLLDLELRSQAVQPTKIATYDRTPDGLVSAIDHVLTGDDLALVVPMTPRDAYVVLRQGDDARSDSAMWSRGYALVYVPHSDHAYADRVVDIIQNAAASGGSGESNDGPDAGTSGGARGVGRQSDAPRASVATRLTAATATGFDINKFIEDYGVVVGLAGAAAFLASRR